LALHPFEKLLIGLVGFKGVKDVGLGAEEAVDLAGGLGAGIATVNHPFFASK
jgi:hypothetical protein